RAVGADIAVRKRLGGGDQALLFQRRLGADEIGDGDAALGLGGEEFFPGRDGILLRDRLEPALEGIAALAFQIAAPRDVVEGRLAEDADDPLRLLVAGRKMRVLVQELADAPQHQARVAGSAMRRLPVHFRSPTRTRGRGLLPPSYNTSRG